MPVADRQRHRRALAASSRREHARGELRAAMFRPASLSEIVELSHAADLEPGDVLDLQRMLPPLGGGAPSVPTGPSSSTGGSAGASQLGDTFGYVPPKGPATRVPLGAPTYEPRGEADESAAVQSFVNSCAESAGLFGPGVINLASAVTIPAISNLAGVNERACRFRATGNNYLFAPKEGDISLGNLTAEGPAAKQVGTGGVVDCSQGFSSEMNLYDLNVGSRLFLPFKINGPNVQSLVFCNNVSFTDILVGAVTGYTGPAFAFGGKATAERTVNCHLTNVGGLTTEAGAEKVPLWFDFNNADTIFVSQFWFQFGTEGIRSGNNDASALRTTGIKFTTGFFDTMSALGFKLQKCRDITLVSLNSQNCTEGGYIGLEAAGTKVHDCTLQHSANNGLRLSPSIAKGTSVRGCTISDNNEGAGVTDVATNGVEVEAGASSFTINDNTIGNVLNYGEKQRNGVVVAVGASNRYSIANNTFEHNVKAGLVDGGAGAEKNVAGNATFA